MPLSARLFDHVRLWLGALGAGACGALLDQLTLTLSSAYFVLGKGLDASPEDLRATVAWMGFRAGLPVGALVTGVAMLCGVRGARAWGRWLGRVAGAAVFVSLLGAWWVPWAAPDCYRRLLLETLATAELTAYLQVLGIHAGVYLGVLVGLAFSAHTSRKKLPAGSPGGGVMPPARRGLCQFRTQR